MHGLDTQANLAAGVRIYYEPTSDGGSRKRSGRYHRARDQFRRGWVWPALYDDFDYRLTQAIGLAALTLGVEGLLVPAASLVTTNLVILTENLLPGSVIEPVTSVDPRLYVPRT